MRNISKSLSEEYFRGGIFGEEYFIWGDLKKNSGTLVPILLSFSLNRASNVRTGIS